MWRGVAGYGRVWYGMAGNLTHAVDSAGEHIKSNHITSVQISSRQFKTVLPLIVSLKCSEVEYSKVKSSIV